MKKKILFLIHDLGNGGAEKVLVNLVNNMDRKKFDITLLALFGGGINERFLDKDICYKTVYRKPFPANSHIMKMFNPKILHRMYIKEKYDIEVAYLEGPAVRIISGCPNEETKLVYWIHCTMRSEKEFAGGFRSYEEAQRCLKKFHGNVFVSKEVKTAFEKYCDVPNGVVLYNTNESDKIMKMGNEPIDESRFYNNEIKLIGVGKIEEVKGFDRLARIHKRLIGDGLAVHTYILGEGSKKRMIQQYIEKEQLTDSFTFLGYKINPYKYIKQSDLFICSSYSEGFSTAATESLILGTPVITTLVSGMKEMLGVNNEWGIITENDEEALYKEIKLLLNDPALYEIYKKRTIERGKVFRKENTVEAVETFLYN